MAHVIGIPLIKGNSEEIMSCNLDADFEPVEGQAVGLVAGGAFPTVGDLAANPFYGFALNVKTWTNVTDGSKGGHCSVVRASDSVAIPTADGFSGADGGDLFVDATGKIADAGTQLNGRIEKASVKGVNGRTGQKDIACALVSFGTGRAVPVAAAPVLTATESANTKKSSGVSASKLKDA